MADTSTLVVSCVASVFILLDACKLARVLVPASSRRDAIVCSSPFLDSKLLLHFFFRSPAFIYSANPILLVCTSFSCASGYLYPAGAGGIQRTSVPRSLAPLINVSAYRFRQRHI